MPTPAQPTPDYRPSPPRGGVETPGEMEIANEVNSEEGLDREGIEIAAGGRLTRQQHEARLAEIGRAEIQRTINRRGTPGVEGVSDQGKRRRRRNRDGENTTQTEAPDDTIPPGGGGGGGGSDDAPVFTGPGGGGGNGDGGGGSSSGGSSGTSTQEQYQNAMESAFFRLYFDLWGTVPPVGYINKMAKNMNLFEFRANERAKASFRHTGTYKDEHARFTTMFNRLMGRY